ncbi:hypothetical protein VE03_03890 [Pseudogymnoascus sp. 23342-1-I1]|nr:hypothetical protein VE03_03890 [Pseudogymnoascus sp. 23342-1-I1]
MPDGKPVQSHRTNENSDVALNNIQLETANIRSDNFNISPGSESQSEPPFSRMEVPLRRQKYTARLQNLHGWRLWVTITTLCFGLFLSTLETTIIATALISIASTLGSYDKSNWIVTAYLVTYTGFLIIFARVSDIFGRKTTFLCALAIFTAFSLACSLAQSITQLIVFRAFQGIGGAGLYSLAMAVMTEVTPLKHIGIVSGLMGSIFALSSILGPILGGVITSNTTWRWVFYLNLPPCVFIILLVIFIFPANSGPLPITVETLSYIDYPGATFSLAGSILLIFGLEQGGSGYPWSSPVIINAFTFGGISLLALAGWEAFISRKSQPTSMLPVFPAQLVTRRVLGCAMGAAFLTGFPFMVTIVFLPQRFQLSNGLTPAEAGIRMLALLLLSALGAGLGGAVSSRRNIAWYILVTALALQLLGLGLLSILPASGPVPARQYGFQAILGLGFGLSLSSLVIVARVEVGPSEVAVTMGAITQVRVLGGVIGIAISQAILNAQVKGELREVLGEEMLAALLRSAAEIEQMTDEQAMATRECYGKAFNAQARIMMYFTVASLLVTLFTFRRRPISLEALDKEQNPEA